MKKNIFWSALLSGKGGDGKKRKKTERKKKREKSQLCTCMNTVKVKGICKMDCENFPLTAI